MLIGRRFGLQGNAIPELLEQMNVLPEKVFTQCAR